MLVPPACGCHPELPRLVQSLLLGRSGAACVVSMGSSQAKSRLM